LLKKSRNYSGFGAQSEKLEGLKTKKASKSYDLKAFAHFLNAFSGMDGTRTEFSIILIFNNLQIWIHDNSRSFHK
jgi:hypothetical protein